MTAAIRTTSMSAKEKEYYKNILGIYNQELEPIISYPAQPLPIAIHSALINEFYLTPLQVSSLNRYYILQWSGTYLQHKTSLTGTIVHQDTEYILVLPECSRAKFYASGNLKLSFRKPKAEYNIPPYVLVRFA